MPSPKPIASELPVRSRELEHVASDPGRAAYVWKASTKIRRRPKSTTTP
jgi:hypothetical protein